MTWRGALPPARPLGFPGMEPQLGVGFLWREMQENTTASPSDSAMEWRARLWGGMRGGHWGSFLGGRRWGDPEQETEGPGHIAEGEKKEGSQRKEGEERRKERNDNNCD